MHNEKWCAADGENVPRISAELCISTPSTCWLFAINNSESRKMNLWKMLAAESRSNECCLLMDCSQCLSFDRRRRKTSNFISAIWFLFSSYFRLRWTWTFRNSVEKKFHRKRNTIKWAVNVRQFAYNLNEWMKWPKTYGSGYAAQCAQNNFCLLFGKYIPTFGIKLAFSVHTAQISHGRTRSWGALKSRKLSN